MKMWKVKILNWLLKDKLIRKAALHEIIGDVEVKQVNINNCHNLNISNCYLIRSNISENEGISFEKNIMDYCSIVGNSNFGNAKEIKITNLGVEQ
jgi:hypothetical protein